jgi:hypothetical protein
MLCGHDIRFYNRCISKMKPPYRRESLLDVDDPIGRKLLYGRSIPAVHGEKSPKEINVEHLLPRVKSFPGCAFLAREPTNSRVIHEH